jgi:hypothetical protein
MKSRRKRWAKQVAHVEKEGFVQGYIERVKRRLGSRY